MKLVIYLSVVIKFICCYTNPIKIKVLFLFPIKVFVIFSGDKKENVNWNKLTRYVVLLLSFRMILVLDTISNKWRKSVNIFVHLFEYFVSRF